MEVFRLKGVGTRNMGKDVVAITQVFFIYRKHQAVFGLSVVDFTASLTTVLESEEGTWVAQPAAGATACTLTDTAGSVLTDVAGVVCVVIETAQLTPKKD